MGTEQASIFEAHDNPMNRFPMRNVPQVCVNLLAIYEEFSRDLPIDLYRERIKYRIDRVGGGNLACTIASEQQTDGIRGRVVSNQQ